MGPHSTARLTLQKPYQVNILLAGYDPKTDTPALNWIDYLGTNVELPYAAHGYAAFYAMSLLDHHYRPDYTTEDGLKLLKLCINELETRMPVDFKGVFVSIVHLPYCAMQVLTEPQVKIVSKDGVKQVDFD